MFDQFVDVKAIENKDRYLPHNRYYTAYVSVPDRETRQGLSQAHCFAAEGDDDRILQVCRRAGQTKVRQ